MNISIRGYIKNNFKDSTEAEIKESIESSMQEQVEETLPGLGVFFETVWQNCNEEEKSKIVSYLKKGLS